MNLDEYKYLWESKKDWVLVKELDEYVIINPVTQMALLVEDEELNKALVMKMLECGNKIYNDIEAAYNDV